MDYPNLTPNQDIDENGLIFELGSLYTFFQRVCDQRKSKGKLYALPLLFVHMVLSKLADEDRPSGMADWVAHRLEPWFELKVLPKKKVPSHMTYRRVLQTTLSASELEALMGEFQQSRLERGEPVIFSMDGKTVRGTIPQGELQGTHLLSIYVPAQGLVLVEAAVDRKENEIVVAPRILRQVHLQGAIVIGNAGHNMAILNNLVIGLCLKKGVKNLAQARRLFYASPQKALELIVTA